MLQNGFHSGLAVSVQYGFAHFPRSPAATAVAVPAASESEQPLPLLPLFLGMPKRLETRYRCVSHCRCPGCFPFMFGVDCLLDDSLLCLRLIAYLVLSFRVWVCLLVLRFGVWRRLLAFFVFRRLVLGSGWLQAHAYWLPCASSVATDCDVLAAVWPLWPTRSLMHCTSANRTVRIGTSGGALYG